MKRLILVLMICLGFCMQVSAQETKQYQQWHIKSFILPGIQSIIDGQYIRGCFFLGVDAIALFVASTPIEQNVFDSRIGWVKIIDYTPLIGGLALYATFGIAENMEVNGRGNTLNLLEIQWTF